MDDSRRGRPMTTSSRGHGQRDAGQWSFAGEVPSSDRHDPRRGQRVRVLSTGDAGCGGRGACACAGSRRAVLRIQARDAGEVADASWCDRRSAPPLPAGHGRTGPRTHRRAMRHGGSVLHRGCRVDGRVLRGDDETVPGWGAASPSVADRAVDQGDQPGADWLWKSLAGAFDGAIMRIAVGVYVPAPDPLAR